ncbi:PleD family two-component system response regulator [Chitinophagaceae bacterium LWZ2-11]
MENILVIDDDVVMQTVISKILISEGYRVDIAGNGKEGLGKIDMAQYDLVITDLMMPYANGFEIISKIKNHRNGKDTSIIIVSSVNNEDSVMEGFKLGVDDYLKKPIMRGELIIRVKKLLAFKR